MTDAPTIQPATPEGREANTAVLRGLLKEVAKVVSKGDLATTEDTIFIGRTIGTGYGFGMECIRQGGLTAVDPEFWQVYLGARKSFMQCIEKAFVKAGGALEDLTEPDTPTDTPTEH